MEEINNFVKGFKAINTPYDKVDNSLYHKRHVMTAIDQLIGGAETDVGKIIEQTDDTVGELPDKPTSMFGAFKKGVYKSFIKHNVILIAIFTLLYYISSYIAYKYEFINTKTNEKVTERYSLFQAFYFTLITQTTVGYGELRPNDRLTQTLNILQLICILATISYHI